jgi:hypothetical protein
LLHGEAQLPATLNARAESVVDKPMFRDAFKRHRCIILASGYYEWIARLFGLQTKSEQSSPPDSFLSGEAAVDVIPSYDSVLLDAGWAESVDRGDGGRDHCHHSQPNEEGYPVLGHLRFSGAGHRQPSDWW